MLWPLIGLRITTVGTVPVAIPVPSTNTEAVAEYAGVRPVSVTM